MNINIDSFFLSEFLQLLSQMGNVRNPKRLKNKATEPIRSKPVHHLTQDYRPTKQAVDERNIIKVAPNGHALVLLKRTRVKGYCVQCIKNNPSLEHRKKMEKIITYCPKCPGGTWYCETCFDRCHLC